MDFPAQNISDTARLTIYPRAFSTKISSAAPDVYLGDPALRKLVEFFESKGLGAIKDEDRREQWYEDWLIYQARHGLYAGLLSPKEFSSRGTEFDLLRITRFLEVFGYFSAAHGYSLQVTFLGLFSILMGANRVLKQEAVAAMESGGLLAFGISEKEHGSDLLAGDFTLAAAGPGRFKVSGKKYYIGNANCATLISILAKKVGERGSKRALPVLFALRPKQAKAFGNVRKIQTLGIRAGFVGEFEVKDHELPQSDIVAEGRDAWDAVFGAITLGKFFLGFGSIGICERAVEEAIGHLTRRILFGKRVIDMPHIASIVSQAYARLMAMKLYAYRTLDYVRSATENDRRYLLFTAVQKAKVSTEGVKVIALLSECMGAKGFEADTYFEMAMRDIQLIPGLEGSTHINLGLTAQFTPRYFAQTQRNLADPVSLSGGENPYLMQARGGAFHTIAFPPFLKAHRPLWAVPNVRLFAAQAKAFRDFARKAGKQTDLSIGLCMATIVYGQLIAENAVRFDVPLPMVSAIFHLLTSDLSVCALNLAASSGMDVASRKAFEQMVKIPETKSQDWDSVLQAAGV